MNYFKDLESHRQPADDAKADIKQELADEYFEISKKEFAAIKRLCFYQGAIAVNHQISNKELQQLYEDVDL